jgi:20S proteasome alpha/beta subunit
MENPINHFKQIAEPRMERCKLHSLEDIIFLTIAGVISGADNFVELVAFAKTKKEWLLKFIK